MFSPDAHQAVKRADEDCRRYQPVLRKICRNSGSDAPSHHHNPVRIGVVERPEDWVYSSARDYAGGKGLIELDTLD